MYDDLLMDSQLYDDVRANKGDGEFWTGDVERAAVFTPQKEREPIRINALSTTTTMAAPTTPTTHAPPVVSASNVLLLYSQ